MKRAFPVVLAVILTAGVAAGSVFAQPPPTEVEAIEAVRKMVPVPKVGEGAPYYSVEQLAAETTQARRNTSCVAKASAVQPRQGRAQLRKLNNTVKYAMLETRIANAAKTAGKATEEAEAVRRRAAEGMATNGEVVAAELARQAAVRAYDKLFPRDELGYDAIIDADPPIAIRNVVAEMAELNGKSVIAIGGEVRNIKRRAVTIPVITVTAYDLDGNLILATAAQPSGARLKKDETRPFVLSIPSWQDVASVEVNPGQHAPFLAERDFCRTRGRSSALAMAMSYWNGLDQRRFNRPPNTPLPRREKSR